jgi:hypothetical protein
MARKYEFPYVDYLASNYIINQAFMEWLWEGENMQGGGANPGPGIVKKHFPEIYDIVDELIELDDDTRFSLEEIQKADTVLINTSVGDLNISFVTKPESTKGKVGVFRNKLRVLIGMNKGDEGPSFTLRKG